MSGGTLEPVAVSRLRWVDIPDIAPIELPHVRGFPIDGFAPDRIARIREWPNRMGVCEPLRTGDRVRWYPDLADPPDDGWGRLDVVASHLDGTTCAPFPTPSRPERVTWLRNLVGAAAQRPDVSPGHPITAPCAIILTPGAALDAPDHESRVWGTALSVMPPRLSEFPGGVQLAVTASVWARRDAYADAVERMLDAQRIPNGGA